MTPAQFGKLIADAARSGQGDQVRQSQGRVNNSGELKECPGGRTRCAMLGASGPTYNIRIGSAGSHANVKIKRTTSKYKC